MSSSSSSTTIPIADNGYMYGGADGNAVSVTPGGNVGTALIYDHIVNVGKIVFRANQLYQLPDIPCAKLKIYAWPTNRGSIWIGGINEQAPQVGAGLPLVAGAKFEPNCTNSNMFSLMSDVVGDTVSITVFAIALANNANITPSNDPSIDETIPAMVSQSPLNGSASQPINSPISFMMNVAIDPSTVTTSNITTSPTISGYQVTVDSTNPKNILILYSGDIQGVTQYTVYIQNLASLTGYVMASQATFSFTTSNTTGPPDTTPPTITGYSPTNGSTRVLTTVNPTITFSKSILGSSINANTVQLTNVNTDSFVTGLTYLQSLDQLTLTIQPPSSLDYGTNYRVDVWNTNTPGMGVEGNNGIYLDKTYSFSFTTKLPYNIVYNVAGDSARDIGYFSGGALSIGLFINSSNSALVGKIPIHFVFTIRRIGTLNLVGNVSFLWLRLSGTTFDTFQTIGTVAADTVPTSYTSYTFDLSTNTTALRQNDYICVYWASGNSSNCIQCMFSSTDVFDGGNTCLGEAEYDTGYSEDYVPVIVTTADAAITLGTSN